MLTVCAVETAAAFAVNVAVFVVAGITIDAGTFTFVLLLASAIVTPPFGADPDRVTLQESATDPTTVELPQESALSAGVVVVPFPERLTVPLPALLTMLNWPEAEPAAVGLKCTVRTTAWPASRDTGKLPPETEKPDPVAESDLMVTGTLPVEVTVTDFVTAVPTATSPNCMEDVLRLIAGFDAEAVDGFSWISTSRDVPFAVADTVTFCALATASMVVMNETALEPAATAAAAGTTTELLVLASATATAFDAFAVRVAVHVVLPEPVNEVLAQEREFSSGAPVAVVVGDREILKDFATPP